MIKKSRTLIFSTALLIMGTFSVHAMEVPKPAKRQNRIKIQKADNCGKYSRQACHPIEKKTTTLNQFDVTLDEYEDVISFYAVRLNQGNFTTLYKLFTKIPVEKRSDALKDLEIRINSRGFRPMFAKYHFLDGIVTDSPTKPKNAISLENKLLQLPHEPIEF